MRALWCLLLWLAVGCGPDGPPATLVAAAPKGPTTQQALYPASQPVLARSEGARFLPKDTPVVLAVADLPALVQAAGMARAFERGGEPYDQVIAATSSWVAGVSVDDVTALAGAGIDPAAVWSAAWFELSPPEDEARRMFRPPFDTRVVFGPVRDEAKLRARLEASAKERKLALIVEPLGQGTLYRTKDEAPERLLVIREGIAYFIRADEGDAARRLAETIATTAPADSLREAPAFAAHLAALAFGPHAAVFVQPQAIIRRAIAGLEREHEALRRSFERLEEQVEEQVKDPDHDEATLARHRRRLAQKEQELASPKKRAAALEGLAGAITGISAGVELGMTGLRAKAHIGFAEGKVPLAKSEAPLPATLGGSDAPLAGLALRMDAAYLRELMVMASSEPTVRRIETELWRVGVDVDEALRGLFDGRVALSRSGGDPGGWTLSLGISDEARAKAMLKAWSEGEDAAELREAEQLVSTDTGLSLRVAAEAKPHVMLAIGGDRIVVATSDEGLAAARADASGDGWWLAQAADPLVARLADVRADGFAVVDARHADAFEMPTPWRMSRGSLAMFGKLGGFDRFAFGGMFGFSNSERAKKLRKQRDEIRGDIASLEERQAIARRTGSDRLLTALGTSVAWLEATPNGITLYGGQIIDENEVAALGEWAVWSIVDSSNASPTAREIAKLQKRLEAIEERIDEENSQAVGAFGLLGRRQMDVDDVLSSSDPNSGAVDVLLERGAAGIGGIGSRGALRPGAGTGSGFGRGSGSVSDRDKPRAGSGAGD